MTGLFTTAAPTAKFKKIGDTVEGEIVDVYRTQRYEFVRGGVGQPLYWHNRKPTPGVRVDQVTGKRNDPVLQYVITVDTGEPDEDGVTERRLFVKNKRMEDGLKKAIIAARAREGMLLGGRLKCTYTGDDEASDAPQLPKMFEFVYTPPAPGQGRQPSGEVRLADREDDEVPAANFNVLTTDTDPAAPPLRNHESSPVLKSMGIAPAPAVQDDEPPF